MYILLVCMCVYPRPGGAVDFEKDAYNIYIYRHI